MCDKTYSHVQHDGFMSARWLIYVCDMTDSYRHSQQWSSTLDLHVRHDSFICATWRIHVCDMTHSYVWYDSFICVIWLIHVCDMTHSCVWHDSFICVTWLIHVCDMPYLYAMTFSSATSCAVYLWHDSFICVTWVIHTCDATFSYMRHDSFVRMCDVTYWHDMTISSATSSAANMHINESRSDPDSKQKTEAELTLWYVLPYVLHSKPFQSKQKQKQGCTSRMWICDHLWHLWTKCDQISFAKTTKTKPEQMTEVTNRRLWHFVTVTHVTHWV